MKICPDCQVEKPKAEFWKNAAQSDGLQCVCKPCSRVRRQQWRLANRDKQNAWNQASYERNKESVLAQKKAYRQAHPEQQRVYAKAYQERFPTRVRAAEQRRREKDPAKFYAKHQRYLASKLQAMPSWANDFFIEEAYRLARRRARVTGIKWHVDHIVPLRSRFVCGLHTHTNIRVIPAAVNVRKQNFYWPDQ